MKQLLKLSTGGCHSIAPNPASLRIHNRAENLVRMIAGNGQNTEHIRVVINKGIKNIMPSKATSESGLIFDDLMCSGNRMDISLIVEGGDKVMI